MISVIKTAIITIMISFISGVLLDTYKNLAPRILCNMRRVRPKKLNGIEFKVYKVTVKNISKKIIHNLSLNVKKDNSINVEGATITTGLKFDLSEEDNTYNVSIPFLSDNDEFSLRILVKDGEGNNNKPIIALRSPEKFKKIYSEDKVKKVSLSGNENRNKVKTINIFKNKKLILGAVGALFVIYVGILSAEYFDKGSNNINTSSGGNTTVNSTSTSSANNSANKSENGSSDSKASLSNKVSTDSQESTGNKVSTDKKGSMDSTESSGNSDKKSTTSPSQSEIKNEEKSSDTNLNKTQDTNTNTAGSSVNENNNTTNNTESTSSNEGSSDLENNTNNTLNNTTNQSENDQSSIKE